MFVQPDFSPRSLDYYEFEHWEVGFHSRGGLTINFFTVFSGDVEPEVAQQAWRYLCLRHPMLGATVAQGHDGYQFIPLSRFPELEIYDVPSEELVEYGLKITHPTNFACGRQLFRSAFISNSKLRRHVFLLVANHAAADAAACLTLHTEFVQALNDLELAGAVVQEKTLPPSLPSLLLGGPKKARFFAKGTLGLVRYNLLRESFPFEQRAPVERRSTSRLVVLLNAPATQLLLERASQEHGLIPYLTARMTRAGYLHMRERGVWSSRTRLGLYVGVDLRSFFGASARRHVCMSTVSQSDDTVLEDGQRDEEFAATIREKIDIMITRKSIQSRLMNWYSPTLVRRGVLGMLGRNRHFGLGATYIGRLSSSKGSAKVLASHGYTDAHHGFYLLGGTMQIVQKRLLLTMPFCNPLVPEETARALLQRFLSSIGANPDCLVTQGYDAILGELAGES